MRNSSQPAHDVYENFLLMKPVAFSVALNDKTICDAWVGLPTFYLRDFVASFTSVEVFIGRASRFKVCPQAFRPYFLTVPDFRLRGRQGF